MKKKLLIMFMLLALIMTGCNEKEEDSKTKKSDVENTKVEEKNEVKNDETKNVADIKNASDFIGEWNGNVYINDYIDAKFNLPDGWKIGTKEDIAKLMNVGAEQLSDNPEELVKLAEENGVYAMLAQDESTGASVTISYAKNAANIDANIYLQALKQELAKIENFKYSFDEIKDLKLSNEAYKVLDATVTVSGQTLIQRYYVRMVDDYIVNVIVTSTSLSDSIDDIVKNFE